MSNTREQSHSAPRIVLYSHDTLGYGHLRRNLLLAGALRQGMPAPRILMVAGMREAGAFAFPEGVDCLTLPAYEKDGAGNYSPRHLGGDLDSLVAMRAATIAAAVTVFDPDLMIVDNVPRGALNELNPLLEALHRRQRTRLVLGLRDVIDRPAVVRKQWRERRNFEAVRRYYDDVWIYGDPNFYDLLADCGLSEPMGAKGRYMGYLNQQSRLESALARRERDTLIGRDTRPYVLCMAGGGRDGVALCRAFVATPMPPGQRGIVITGSQMPRALRDELRQRAQARSDLLLVDFAREPIALMAGAERIVAMGGYNTICEVLSLGRPALISPRVTPRAEQLLRAEQLVERGLVSMLHPDNLRPATLSAWLTADAPAPGPAQLDMAGLERVRQRAAEMLAESRTLPAAS